MEIKTKLKKRAQSKLADVDFDNLPFGRVFSDHMLVITYKDGQWEDGIIQPYEALALTPAIMTLHYGQAIFEGMKANKDTDGNILMFRPELNIRRFNKSAERMCMPTIPEDVFLEKLQELIYLDSDWIPNKEGAALYIRPFMFGSDPYIGVKPSKTYHFVIFTCPVGPYYANPVSVYAEDHYARAVNGGTGFTKAAGNYGGSLYPAKLAQEKGYDQVLWTDSNEHKYVQEIGTMNVFFVIDDVVITPELNDCILPGTTRQSVIELFKDQGVTVEERPLSIDEIFEAHDKGVLQDCFGSGTAAAIIPIASLGAKDKKIELPPVEDRKYWSQMKERLLGIKLGTVEDKFNWTRKIAVPQVAGENPSES